LEIVLQRKRPPMSVWKCSVYKWQKVHTTGSSNIDEECGGVRR
jgi:hypothetical protein